MRCFGFFERFEIRLFVCKGFVILGLKPLQSVDQESGKDKVIKFIQTKLLNSTLKKRPSFKLGSLPVLKYGLLYWKWVSTAVIVLWVMLYCQISKLIYLCRWCVCVVCICFIQQFITLRVVNTFSWPFLANVFGFSCHTVSKRNLLGQGCYIKGMWNKLVEICRVKPPVKLWKRSISIIICQNNSVPDCLSMSEGKVNLSLGSFRNQSTQVWKLERGQ